MDNDSKKSIKDAREAVKNKDFEKALELCKIVLKNEKGNYLALVLSAVSFQELGQADKALIAFVKATELQPSQITAWQGLAAFLEQERDKLVLCTDSRGGTNETINRLIAVYDKLEELLANDPQKQLSIVKKQCELYGASGNVDNCVKKGRILLGKNEIDSIKFAVKVLCPLHESLGESAVEMLESALEKVIPHCDSLESLSLAGQRLTLLMKQAGQNERLKALAAARQILQQDPKHPKSLEAICQIVTEDPSIAVANEELAHVIESLSQLQPANKHAALARGVLLLNKGAYFEAKQAIQALCAKEKTQTKLRLLCQAYRNLHQWTQLEAYCKSALGLASSDREMYSWNLLLAESLLERDSDLTELSALMERLESDSKEDLTFHALKALYLIRMKDSVGFRHQKERLVQIDPAFETRPQFARLQAEYLCLSNDRQEAIQLLERGVQQHPNDVQLLLYLAQLLWAEPEQRSRSVGYLLSAIKVNRDLAKAYVYLASFYAAQAGSSSLERAIRCLEKAFQLEPQRLETAERLFDLYVANADTTSALKLLEVVIRTRTDCRWAWVKKGSLHLKRVQQGCQDQEKEATLSISALQNALRVDNADHTCWETLGDAYLARGSYTAAMKAFQKASELQPSSVYAKYQTATIKQKLGENEEAVKEYESLLSDNADYVPALKGLAETLQNQANEYQVSGSIGRLVDCCFKSLQLLVRATKLKPNLSCLWSLMGNVCLTLRPVPEHHFQDRQIDPSLLCGTADTSGLDNCKQHLMQLGIKFFLASLKLSPDCAVLWHNLSLSYSSCGDRASAFVAAKKAITLNPSESLHWNLLADIADDDEQPAIAQHAYIRALELKPKSAESWTNLGSLYLRYGNEGLAHSCFQQAQNADPFYVPAWIGQANVAELVKPEEAMDLFRHTVAIGSAKPEECLGGVSYGQWVVSTLLDPTIKTSSHYRYSIVEMHAVPTAVDALVRYVALHPFDSCALNLLALLYERQGLLVQAEKALLQGISALEGVEPASSTCQLRLDKMRANLARVYTSLSRYDDATQLYASLQESELSSACGIALAHFKAARYAEAYETYFAAEHWLAEKDELKSHLNVAMAMSAFRRDFPDTDQAKSLLFQSCQLQPPSVYGLLALAALGLLSGDGDLSDAAFQEMLAYQTQERYVADIAFLSAYQHWSQNDLQRATRELCRNIHMLPNTGQLWTLLSTFQASKAVASAGGPIDPTKNNGLQIARCAEIAFEARRIDCRASESAQQQQTELAKILSLVSIGYLMAGRRSSAVIAAQKAVHCDPQSAATWSVLLSAAAVSWTGALGQQQSNLVWLKRLIGHLRRNCDVAAFSGLATWLGSYEKRLAGLIASNGSQF